jgi:hypothetical protein
MALPFDQVVREQRFIKDHPEWQIHAEHRGTRFTAEKAEGKTSHVVAALSLEELLNRLDEIVAGRAGRGQTEARAAERGLTTLTRGDYHDSQRSSADAQEAAIQHRDAEARDEPDKSPDADGTRATHYTPAVPEDQPEQRLEAS